MQNEGGATTCGGGTKMQNMNRCQNAELEAWPKCRIGGVAKMQNRRRGQNAE